MSDLGGIINGLTSAGPALSTIAVIVVTILFLRFLGDERKDRAEERKADRESRAEAHRQFVDTMDKQAQLVNVMVENCKSRH